MSRIAINDLTLQDTPFLFDLTDEEMLFITGGKSIWQFFASVGETIAGGVVAAVGVVVAAVGFALFSTPILDAGADLFLTGVGLIDYAWK